MALAAVVLGFAAAAFSAGQPVIGEIKIVGNQKIDSRVILTEMWLKPGDPYSAEAVKKARQRIMNLRYFQFVKITEQKNEGANAVNLTIEVKERITWGIMPIVSLDGDDTDNNEYGLRVDENCLLGLGKSVSLRGSTTKVRDRYAVSYDDPQLMFTRFVAGAGLTSINYDWEDFNITDDVMEGYVYGGYRPTYETEVVLRLTIREDDFSAGVLDAQTTKVGVTVSYSDVEYYIDSLRGIGVTLLLEQGTEAMGGDEELSKVTLSASYNYRMPNKHWIRAVVAGGGGNDLPWHEDFTAGGNGSIRGYAPGYRGPGDRYARASAQYEAPVWYPRAFGFSGTLAVVGFVDVGDAWGYVDDSPEFVTGAGVGVRGYVRELQAFTFALDVGYGFEEQEVQTHLTFGGSF